MRLRFPCLFFLLASAAAAQTPDLFEAPWTAYNAGYFIEAPGGGGEDGRWPAAAAAPDLNGDGRADLVLARDIWNSGVAVVLSSGDGYAPPAFYDATYPVSNDVAAADFDGDGDTDLVTSDGYLYGGSGRRVSVYPNRGDGTFDPPAGYPVTATPTGVTAADLDGDGDLDIATCDYSWHEGLGFVSVLLNTGSGAFAPALSFSIAPNADDLAAGDLDGDGDLDLAVAHNSDYLSVLFNDGSGRFSAPVQLEGLGTGGTILFASVAVTDLDGDGDLDIAAGHNRTEGIALFDNHGDGTFAPVRLAELPPYRGGPASMAAGDLNGDGRPDLLVGAANLTDVRVVLNDGTGAFLPAQTVIAGQWTDGLALGDADGDGDLDLVTADHYSMAATVHLNDGAGRFPEAPTVRWAEGTLADSGDLDGDGHLDFISTTGTVYTYLGNGDGTFAAGPTYIHGRDARSPRLADLDGDGVLDLLFAADQALNPNVFDFYTAKGNGGGSFGPATRWVAGALSPPTVDAFDFDGDGDRDVLIMVSVNDLQHSPVRIYRNDGAGAFSFANEFLVEAGPSAAVGGDFNGDGRLDFATAHQGAYGAFYYVNVHLGNGDLTFQPYVHYDVAFGPAHIRAADLNGDGVLDLATGNTGSGNEGAESVSVLLGHGDGSFAPSVTYYAPYNPVGLGLSGLAAGDPDGDGDVDLMASSWSANDVSFYENRGDGTFTFHHRYGIGKGASRLFYADVTGDGLGDLISITSGFQVYSPYLTVLRGTGGAPQAPVAVEAQPVGGPPVIGPGGGRFTYRVTLTNQTGQPQTFQAWTAVTGPVNREPVLAPRTVTLPAGATVTRTLTQRVPANAPAGTYTYHVRAGTLGGTVFASDSFPFTKQAGAQTARGEGADWSVSGWDEATASAVEDLPGGFALSEAHPNPFARQATLTLEVAAAQHVTAEAYDALGRRVAVLADGAVEAGVHALVLDGSRLPSGVYVVRVAGETFAATRRVTLVR